MKQVGKFIQKGNIFTVFYILGVDDWYEEGVCF